MTILHLGVVDVPYTNAPEEKPGGGRRSGTQTTGDVAQWLEDKYSVMQHYVDWDMQNIEQAVENSLAGALETFMQTGKPVGNPLMSATEKIQTNFKAFLTQNVVATLGIPGVPTQAALGGTTHRKKSAKPSKKRKMKPRPSFVDTGLYRRSFRAWSD